MIENIKFTIPVFTEISSPSKEDDFEIAAGNTLIMVGANGSGKTRLAAFIEKQLGKKAHRISAHRALELNPKVNKINQVEASNLLFSGRSDGDFEYRKSARWNRAEETAMLNDFDNLLQYLFAEQNNIALETHKKATEEEDKDFVKVLTKLQKLRNIFSRLLPHRELVLTGDDINVKIPDTDVQYSASQMSDGERSLFYMIGQVLAAREGQLLIIDEPELHIHRSIMSQLWDELESIRPDCAFLFITHDLEFAALRPATKYIICDFRSEPDKAWNIEEVPENTGFKEEVTTLILGSRKPILFVEGNDDSLDVALYRHCYPEWTLIPRSSCGEVIYAVSTLRKNNAFTRIECAGLIDNDHRDDIEIEGLKKLGVYTLPVNEIENIILLPEISRVILEKEEYDESQIESKLKELSDKVFEIISTDKEIENATKRYLQRYINRKFLSITFDNKLSTDQYEHTINTQIENWQISKIIKDFKETIHKAIKDEDLITILKVYDNKGLLAKAVRILRNTDYTSFIEWLQRILSSHKDTKFTTVVKAVLPNISLSQKR